VDVVKTQLTVHDVLTTLRAMAGTASARARTNSENLRRERPVILILH
jgi:hypothetical protein